MRKIVIILSLFLPQLIYAETIVPKVIDSDLWIKQNSPYIVDSDILVKGTLTIDPGVVIKTGHANVDSFKVTGKLEVKGTREDPVIFESNGDELKNWSLQIDSPEQSFIKHAIFKNSLNGLLIKQGEVIFDHVTFSDLSSCLVVDHAKVNLSNSLFTNCNNTSVYLEQSLLNMNTSSLIGNEENQGILSLNNSSIYLASSSLGYFANALIPNDSTVVVNGTDFLSNKVGISSKTSDVSVESSSFQRNEIGISVFMPGPASSGGIGNALSPKDQFIVHNSEFIGSLEKDIINTSHITVDASMNWWGSNDGPKINEGNISVNPWIVKNNTCCSNVLFIPGFQASRLLIPNNKLWEPNRNLDVEKLFLNEKGIPNIAAEVSEIIDKGIGYKIYDSLIKEMDSLVLDHKINSWLPYPYDWRKNQIELAKDIAPTFERLASSSITGKVHIVSHSNGGLVAKALLKALKDKGKENLIDSIIFIAVPHLGTPKAIASILYGYDQQIAKGLILNQKTARQFGYNMPGAYGLLPKNYIPGVGGVASSSNDLEKPIAVNKHLINQAKKLHQVLDSIDFPKVFSITGWNIQTLDSLSTATKRGDGTVIASSSDIFDEGYYFNLAKFNQENKRNISHADITEAPPVLALIKDIVSSTTDNTSVYGSYINKNYPILSKKDENLQIKMFSPIDIHVYDSEGRHTGLVLNQKRREIEMDMEPGFVTFIDEEIPNSSYSEFMGVKSITVPNQGKYTLKGIGTDAGVFTLQTSILNSQDEEKVLARYEELPVLKDSKIELNIDTQTNSSKDLKIDIENDGIFEKTVKANKRKNKINLKTFLDFCKKILPYIKKHDYHKYMRDYFDD